MLEQRDQNGGYIVIPDSMEEAVEQLEIWRTQALALRAALAGVLRHYAGDVPGSRTVIDCQFDRELVRDLPDAYRIGLRALGTAEETIVVTYTPSGL